MHECNFSRRIIQVILLTRCFNELWALPVERPGSSEMDCWIPSANHTAKGMARRQKRQSHDDMDHLLLEGRDRQYA